MEVSIKKGLFASVTYLILKIISWLWVNGVSIFLWQATKKLVTRIHRLASFSLLAYYLICSFLARGPVTHSLRANFSCSLAICFVSQLRTRTECCASWIGRRGGVVWGGDLAIRRRGRIPAELGTVQLPRFSFVHMRSLLPFWFVSLC